VCHSEGASAASKIVSRFSNVFAGTATLSCTYLDSSGCAGRWGRWGARKGLVTSFVLQPLLQSFCCKFKCKVLSSIQHKGDACKCTTGSCPTDSC